jgi:transposase
MGSNKKFIRAKVAASGSRLLNPSVQKVGDAVFKNNEFFDAQDAVQVRYEMLRRVQVEGLSVTEVAKSFGVSRLSFYRILAAFEKEGMFGLRIKKRGPKQGHKLSAPVLKFIERQIQMNSGMNRLELKKAIKKKYKVSVHPGSIERALSRRNKKRLPS